VSAFLHAVRAVDSLGRVSAVETIEVGTVILGTALRNTNPSTHRFAGWGVPWGKKPAIEANTLEICGQKGFQRAAAAVLSLVGSLPCFDLLLHHCRHRPSEPSFEERQPATRDA